MEGVFIIKEDEKMRSINVIIFFFLLLVCSCQTGLSNQLASNSLNSGSEFNLFKNFKEDVETILKKTQNLQKFKMKEENIF